VPAGRSTPSKTSMTPGQHSLAQPAPGATRRQYGPPRDLHPAPCPRRFARAVRLASNRRGQDLSGAGRPPRRAPSIGAAGGVSGVLTEDQSIAFPMNKCLQRRIGQPENLHDQPFYPGP
jgi:hypothetical protein